MKDRDFSHLNKEVSKIFLKTNPRSTGINQNKKIIYID